MLTEKLVEGKNLCGQISANQESRARRENRCSLTLSSLCYLAKKNLPKKNTKIKIQMCKANEDMSEKTSTKATNKNQQKTKGG